MNYKWYWDFDGRIYNIVKQMGFMTYYFMMFDRIGNGMGYEYAGTLDLLNSGLITSRIYYMGILLACHCAFN